jgi:hypothetical protein
VPRITGKERSTSVHTPFPQRALMRYRSVRAHLARYRQVSTFAIHMQDNDLWKTSLLHFSNGLSTLPSPRSPRDRATTDFAIPPTCISSSVLDRKNLSRTRPARRCSRRRGPRVERTKRGTGFGPRGRTTISFDARPAMARHGGSASRTTWHRWVNPSHTL